MKFMKVSGLVALALAATAFAADGVVLKTVYKKGDVVKIKTIANIDFGGTAVKAEIRTQSTVKEVAEDGTVTLVEKMVEGKAEVGGQEMALPETPETMTVITAEGLVKEIRGEDTSPAEYRMYNLQNFIPSKDAVMVGSKWNQTLKGDKDKGSFDVEKTYEILAEEKVMGYDTFKIKIKSIEKEGSEPAAVEGTIWMNKSDCSMVKFTGKWINFPMPAAPAPLNGDFTTTREK